MTEYLLDTNVVSELTKRRPDPRVVAWLTSEPTTWLSVLSLGELLRGAHLLRPRDPVAAGRVDTWIEQLRSDYDGRILPVDHRVIGQWAALPTTRTLPVIDSLLAATALAHDLTIATRNVRDFADTSAPIFDPFG
ncbi:MAG: type II toxin-antitoxin system VapC family toxin [Micropruina sp.]|uniref:type II toxin-antitoxin system VapC family toxin n=1 Tax=Micropruina sp. TaxID=2737536 RepID=UPI0039E6FED1